MLLIPWELTRADPIIDLRLMGGGSSSAAS
jgi:hypothetical protein